MSNRLIRCDRCGTLYDPDWKSGCAAGMCSFKTHSLPYEKQPLPTNTVESLAERVKRLEARISELERIHGIYGA